MSTTQTEPTDILGKIGKFLGTEHNELRVSIGQTYATKVSVGQQIGAINIPDVSGLATQVSLDNYANGTSVFDLLKATRAELGELKVSGKTTIVDTQTIEVSDNILELNLAEDGGETAQTSGLSINRGQTGATQSSNNPDNYDGSEILQSSYTWSVSGTSAVASFVQTSFDNTARSLRDMYSVRNPAWAYNLWDLSFSNGDILLRKNTDTTGATANWTQQHTIGTYDESTNAITMIAGWTLTLKEDSANINRWTIDQLSFSASSASALDKATILWDDTANRWKINVGTTDADFEANKLYFKNMFAQLADLPSATDYHGMVAHVHATQALYFAHGGQWVELISSLGGQTINGALTLTGALGVSSGTNLTINSVALGDYSSFSNAFTAALNA